MRNILERRKNGGIIYLRFIQFYLKKINKRLERIIVSSISERNN